jgi:hypothetical protein
MARRKAVRNSVLVVGRDATLEEAPSVLEEYATRARVGPSSRSTNIEAVSCQETSD